MQMVKKILLVIVVVIFSFMVFAPKRELYYLLEDKLMKYDVIISGEDTEEGFFSIGIEHPKIYVKGIELANIDRIDIFSLLAYSTIEVDGIDADSSLKRLMPAKVMTIRATYQLLDPLKVAISVVGDFGRADGYLYIKESRVRLDIVESKDISRLKHLLRKDGKGWYYETAL
ncbi:hypothetical protein MNB_SV-6-703 [hydrothermal vent metagenome]|uniref:AsmA domain-containing protein n=1 Tax=hydrothermal vent metagenome TaxID=652676 RepID=A0A1W1BUN8_9ZZZZ